MVLGEEKLKVRFQLTAFALGFFGKDDESVDSYLL